MGAAASEAVYRFDRFILDLARGALLSVEGREILLRPKAFALLRLLVENSGRLLDRDIIMQAVWPGVTVADDGITQCVRDIRRALGSDSQRLLKTVPRRGYILASKVSEESARSTLGTLTAEIVDRPAIAILPFANLSNDSEQEFFSDGIADDLITELSRNRSLFVIARNSSFTYRGRSIDLKHVARELRVRYLVEGSVRRDAKRVRINAQLIDTESGQHVWAERYDRKISSVFAVQDEITSAIVTAVCPALADAEFRRTLRKPLESLGAWEAYQRGRWHMGRANPADNAKAKDFFQRAITLDAMFSPAYAAMAMTYMHEGLAFATLPLQETAKLAGGWARTAVEIDANDADAHAILAWTTAIGGATQEVWEGVSLALAINPNSTWANAVKGAYLLFTGQPSQAREALVTALRLDPRGPISVLPLTQIAVSYYFERDYEQSADAARRAVVRYPELPLAHRYLAAALGQLGRIDEANDTLQKAIELSVSSFNLYVRNRPPWFRAVDHEHILEGLRKAGWRN